MRKLTLYVIRQNPCSTNDYSYTNSSPCYHCAKKIKEIGIGKIIYVDNNGKVTKCRSKNYNTKYISSGYKEYARKNIYFD